MRAVVCKSFGPPENLVLETVEDPSPAEGEVIVDVRAAAITFPDTLIIEDRYQFKATPPFTLGGEVAGVVGAVGEGVTDFAVGDDVVGGRGTGGFAERLAVPAASLRPLPEGLEYAEATASDTPTGPVITASSIAAICNRARPCSFSALRVPWDSPRSSWESCSAPR